jgi:hypothetical protein
VTAKTKLPEVVLRGPKALPSPNDWEDFERRILEGEDPQMAANARGLTLSNYRRQDELRQRALLKLSREARADEADRRLEDWVTRAEASDQIKVYFHRYHAQMAGRGIERVEVEVSSDAFDDIARFTEAVAAAALRSASGGGAGEPHPDVVAGGEGRARLAVAELAREAEPARA